MRRVDARLMCEANGWLPGTRLRSSAWPAGDRILLKVQRTVVLRLPSGNHQPTLKLPYDTEAVDVRSVKSALQLLKEAAEDHHAAAASSTSTTHVSADAIHHIVASELEKILARLCLP